MAKPRKRIRGHSRSCANKHKFKTIDEARAACKIPNAGYMEAYKCRKCKNYHFGHPKIT